MNDADVGGSRLAYVRERKHFLNQKVYEIFEKYQIAILTYLGYALLIFVGVLKDEYDKDVAEELLALSQNVIAVLVCVFLLFMIIIVFEWRKYENEENLLAGLSTTSDWSSLWKWIETWMIVVGVAEYFAVRWLVNSALSIA